MVLCYTFLFTPLSCMEQVPFKSTGIGLQNTRCALELVSHIRTCAGMPLLVPLALSGKKVWGEDQSKNTYNLITRRESVWSGRSEDRMLCMYMCVYVCVYACACLKWGVSRCWIVSSFTSHTKWSQSMSSVSPNLHHCANARNSDKYMATVSPWQWNPVWNRYRCTISEGGELWCWVITSTRSVNVFFPGFMAPPNWTTACRHLAQSLPKENISLPVGVHIPVGS